jgi:hypothetical protein
LSSFCTSFSSSLSFGLATSPPAYIKQDTVKVNTALGER